MGKVVFGIVFIFLMFFMGYMHESAHVEIFRAYGIKSHIEYFSHFPDWVTIPEANCPNDMCKLAHNINDIVTYNLVSLFILIGAGVLLWKN